MGFVSFAVGDRVIYRRAPGSPRVWVGRIDTVCVGRYVTTFDVTLDASARLPATRGQRAPSRRQSGALAIPAQT